MASQATKVKNIEPADAAPAASAAVAPPVIKPGSVQVNDAGQVSRSVLVRAPEGMCADDLRDPKVFRLVQATPVAALCKMDRLLILAFDESWIVEALVRHATNTEARLLILRVSGFSEVGDRLFNDGVLECFWDGASYGVRRMSDKIPVARGFQTEGLAIDALRAYYPKVVSR